MDRIDEHKRVEEDQVQGKGKTKVFPPKRRDPRPNGCGHSQPRIDYFNQTPRANAQVVSSMLKGMVYQILEKIKNKPYFKWPNKMGGDPFKRNQSLYCQYHQDWGQNTKDCITLCDHLE